MRTAASLALALTFLCAPAFAGGGPWKFTPGTTYTWDGTTEFHYEQEQASRAEGGTSFQAGSKATIGDPQWETITFKATVVSVDPDGAGHLEFSVEAVHIETRFDSGGEHAEWDSRKSPTTDVEGYKRYQAILGNTFSAVIGPEGSVREVEGAEWSLPGPSGEEATKKLTNHVARIEKAARETHDPTPPSVWLGLLFGTTPERRSEWTRSLLLPLEEKLAWRLDSDEQVGTYLCARTKLESVDKKRMVKPGDVKIRKSSGGNEVGDFAMALCDAARKKGTVWFSRGFGCLVKAELEAATEYLDPERQTRTHFKWSIDLKERGTASAAPRPNGATPTK